MNDPRFEEALRLAARRADLACRERAVQLLEALVAEGAVGPPARFLLASLYDDHPDGLSRAIDHYRSGLAGDPSDSAARNNLAVALMATGRLEEAVAELSAVLVADPSYGLAARNLAELVADQLDDPALGALLTRLTEAGNGEALTRLVRAMREQGRQDAFESTYSTGHALKNLVGLAGSKVSALARKLPEPASGEAKDVAQTLEKAYGEWASFLKAARSVAQRREPCDLCEISRDVALAFAEAQRPRLRLPETLQALGDPAALREAILNLARNAREASPTGDVELSAEADASGRWVRLQVLDDGPGISPENLRRIFSPGFTTKRQGSGFGLSIVERIVRAEGGSIEVESRPGKGSRFVLVLPAATATPPRLAPRLAPEEFTR